jgi:hypothetical protein
VLINHIDCIFIPPLFRTQGPSMGRLVVDTWNKPWSTVSPAASWRGSSPPPDYPQHIHNECDGEAVGRASVRFESKRGPCCNR